MNRFWEDINKINEDFAVIDDDSPIYINTYFDKDASQAIDVTLDPNAYDIISRGQAFVEWLEEVEKDVKDEHYRWHYNNQDAYFRLFVEDVLKFNYFGPEMHQKLKNFTIQLKLKAFTYNSGVLDPEPWDRLHNCKYIINRYIDRDVNLEATGLDDIRGFVEYFVKAFLVERISVQSIAAAIKHFWIFEELPEADNLTNELTKIYLDIKYKNGHKQFPEASALIQKLRNWLEGLEWELRYYKEDNPSQALVLYGNGLTDNLRWLIKGGDIGITSFSVIGGDL